MLKPFSNDDALRFREFLAEVGYYRAESREKLLIRGLPSPRERNLPRLIDQTRERTPLQMLLRWFMIGVPVDTSTAVELMPAWLMELCTTHGLLGTRGEMTIPLVMLSPWHEQLIASDPVVKLDAHDSANVVIWPNPTTLHLSRFTIRRPVQQVLDLGTGSGPQAIQAAGHSAHVVATDLNQRAIDYTLFNARMNGLDNIEGLTGDTFEPVKNRKFDLIVTNPPFFLSPVAKHMFSDNSMELDQYCRRVIREGAEHLNEGGYLQMMLEWAEVKGQPWRDRLTGWLEGTGCDAWVWREYGTEADQYAQNRIRETTAYSPTGDEATFNEWMTYYREKQVQRVHGGILAMRRRAGQNWIQIDEMPSEPTEPFGDSVFQLFQARDFLAAHADDAMLDFKPQLSANAELLQRARPGGSEWEMTSLNLTLKKGVRASLALDPMSATFVGQCNGARTLKALIQELASGVEADPDQVQAECVTLIRRLIERGLMRVPV